VLGPAILREKKWKGVYWAGLQARDTLNYQTERGLQTPVIGGGERKGSDKRNATG